ncbi:PREDICTED: uncharacterized protein LOC106815505 [Priapulus caudatus]|uniref:Glycosyltransferase family 92 protein n=1 Tax=Priapulus caudatus TaxID=37621 RepID=A0ABM1ETD4_PRICU|nr:PREDICTED: uncharacterized protein LOC106815505 [Priapulus caudatus]
MSRLTIYRSLLCIAAISSAVILAVLTWATNYGSSDHHHSPHSDNWRSYLYRWGQEPAALHACRPPRPASSDVRVSNIYWQEQAGGGGARVYLYSAYLDRRIAGLPFVRVLAMSARRMPPTTETYCAFWYDSDTERATGNTAGNTAGTTTGNRTRNATVMATTVRGTALHIWSDSWGAFTRHQSPYLISCAIPDDDDDDDDDRIPSHVSLMINSCEKLTNLLRVDNRRETTATRDDDDDGRRTQENFAVCVKGLNFDDDISLQLVEWIELHALLGAARILFYVYHVPRSVDAVLRHYSRQGLVQLIPATLPGGQPSDARALSDYISADVVRKRRNEILLYNDCLYRSINRYRHLVLVDVDEIIVPLGNRTSWRELLDVVAPLSRSAPKTMSVRMRSGSLETTVRKYAAYSAANMYYFVEMGDEAAGPATTSYFTRRCYRNESLQRDGQAIKSFFNTRGVLTLYNHQTIQPMPGYGRTFAIPPTLARLNHYKSIARVKNAKVVHDCSLRHYSDVILKRIRVVREELGSQ